MQLKHFFSLVFIFANAFFVLANEPEAEQSKSFLVSERNKTTDRISYSLALDNYFSMYQGDEFVSVFTPGLGFSINKKHNFSFELPVTKLYLKNPGESEVKLGDLDFSYAHSFKIKDEVTWLDSLSLVLASSIPTSLDSRLNNVLTRTFMGLSLSKKYNNFLKLSLKPHFGYAFNYYKTTKTDPGTGGGSYLPRWYTGASLGAGIDLTKKISWSSSFRYRHMEYERPSIVNNLNQTGKKITHPYAFSTSLAYLFSDNVNFSMTYYYSNTYERPGGYEFFLYDQDSSQVVLSASMSI